MLNYPVISKFENANDISVNVYSINENNVKKSKKKPVEKVNDEQRPDEIPSECESDGRCHFLDDEAEASGSDSDEEKGDLDGFIDNEELNEGALFYHVIDRMRHRQEIDNINETDTDTDTDIEIL